jgi:hypothetical protein
VKPRTNRQLEARAAKYNALMEKISEALARHDHLADAIEKLPLHGDAKTEAQEKMDELRDLIWKAER